MASLLYLIRHADAVDMASDAARPLSKKGRNQVAELARVLGRAGAFNPGEIWHSPLVRARETAELLAHELKLKPAFSEHRELVPEADPAVIVRKLAKAGGAVAIVGHEPHLSSVATLLVTGTTEPVVFVMRKCAILCLECAGRHCVVRWHLSPDVVG